MVNNSADLLHTLLTAHIFHVVASLGGAANEFTSTVLTSPKKEAYWRPASEPL